MGSSNKGRFSDYTGSGPKTEKDGGLSGGTSGQDRCGQAFNVNLEDIGLYQLFAQTGKVPAPGTKLTVQFQTRIVAVDANGLTVGALPTAYNYLAACLKAGYTYSGTVQSSSLKPVPAVNADFVPN